jgi:hypothetical protein
MSDDTGWLVLARIADVLGVVGFLVVAVSLVSAYLTRPRILFDVASYSSDSLVLALGYRKGSRAARNLNVGYRGLSLTGLTIEGDDSIWRRPVLAPGDIQWFLFQDSSVVTAGIFDQPNSLRMQVNKPLGILIYFTWDRPLLPWTRARQAIVWTQSDRAAMRPPASLTGRKAGAAYVAALPSAPTP